MFRMIHAQSLSDATECYDIVFDRPTTVGEFIQYILHTRLHESGEIILRTDNKKFMDALCNGPKVTYSRPRSQHSTDVSSLSPENRILSDTIDESLLKLLITKATANGGWGQMSYMLEVGESSTSDDQLNDRAKFNETDDDQTSRIASIRKAFSAVYDAVEEYCKPGRETSLAMTKLEEAQFWAIKGISREGENK